MNVLLWSLALFLVASTSHAIHVPISRFKLSGFSPLEKRAQGHGATPYHLFAAGNSSKDLSNVRDLIYTGNITVGGGEYPVQLDTGSSDLWVKGPVSPLPDTLPTSISYNLSYGLGWAYGNIGFSPVEFSGIRVENQSFLDVSVANNPALGYGAQGLLGLGFTSLSNIDYLMNKTGSSAGRSFLFNAFSINPQQPNFISFALSRSSDDQDEVNGAITIGEYVPEYKQIEQTPAIPTWPVKNPKRWNVLLEAFHVGATPVTVTSKISNAPANRAVVLLDTGTSYTYAPPEACQTIYGGIPGAQYDSTSRLWLIPCGQEVDVALQINQRIFPMHPLDMTIHTKIDNQTCAGSFIPQEVSVGEGQFDWLIGDNVLRNIYSVYDFGDFDGKGKMGDPFVKLLPLIDPTEASGDFATVRGSQPRTNITYNVVSSEIVGAASNGVSASQATLDRFNTLIPIMLGVMGLNALVLLTLIIFAIVYICRKKESRAARRARRQSTLPMPMSSLNNVEAAEPTYQYEAVINDEQQIPQSPSVRSIHSTHSIAGPQSPRPVSTVYPQSLGGIPGNVKDDPFKTPPPSFQRDRVLERGIRPHSSFQPINTRVAQINVHPPIPRSAPADHESFVPPSPGFFRRDFPSGAGDDLGPGNAEGLRPNSIA
ncbi:acid protease [Thelephora ganbajun]|uniref:Acid protease n=1 Tax=Thelephora ganbajun TaxID=370292 RepID=A0ACB6ZNK7_THEGA|nr:acid protease [Thelephora ganbajun]